MMEIKPYQKNAKKHPKKQIEQVANSIKEFGMNQPIVVDKQGVIIVGHGRYEALKHLGMPVKDEYIKVVDLTEEQAQAYRLADNKLNESEWDMNLVIEELKGLSDEMLELTGFDKDLIIEPDEQDDEVPDVPEEPQSKLGDLYELGNHRVLCGDSTKLEDVERLMDGKKADMVFTSPPYNADAKAGQGDIFNGKKSVKLYSDGYSDKLPSSEYVDFAASVLEVCFAVTDGFIFWNVSYNAKSRFEYIQQISGRLPYLVEQICWKKSSTIPFKGSLMRDWEPVFLFSTNKQPVAVKEVTSNFWQISNTGAQAENHKACFPVALPEKGISIVANNTGLVFDPFGGSGSTLIACEKTGREARLMELDPKYVDVIVRRWCEFTGKQATLEATGATFAEVEADSTLAVAEDV